MEKDINFKYKIIYHCRILYNRFLYGLKHKKLIKQELHSYFYSYKIISSKYSQDKNYHAKFFYKATLTGGGYSFLKVGINDKSVENEYFISKHTNQLAYCNKMIFGKQLRYKNAVISICAFEYLMDYYTIEKPPVDKNLFFDNLYKILIDMQEHLFVHCDFSKRNIMVNKNCDIKLIDFGLSHIKGFDNEELYKHIFWGNGFNINGNIITYDDIDALKWILLSLYPDCISEDCYKNIMLMKGKNTFVTRIK